jgi:hypothetical protein
VTLAARGLFLFGVLVAISTVTGVVLNYSPVPFWDQWFGVVSWYIAAEQHWWPSFWSLHNEHRLLFSRLIFWPEMRWFGGVNILSFVANVTICAFLALSIYRTAIYRTAIPDAARWAIGGVVLAFCFSWMQSENFTWAFQNQWFSVNLFAVLAFHAMAISASKAYSRVWFALGLLAAVGSALSMANGSFTWPVLIALTLYWRFPPSLILLTVLTAAVEVTAYYWHADGVATGSLPNGTFSYVIRHQPIDLIRYAVSYLGSPMWHGFHRPALAFAAGVVVMAGTAAGVFMAIRRRDLRAMPMLAWAVFLCLTALATGVGRLAFGLGTVFQTRYATNGLMVWLALLLFWIPNTRHRALRWPLYGATLAALVAIAICQPAALRPDTKTLFARLEAGQAIREGVYDHAYLGLLWDHDDYLKTVIEAARREQLSILAPHAIGYDVPPARITTETRCAGAVDGSVPTATEGKSRAEGWVFDPSSGTVPRTVVITDAAGNTIGNGVVGKKRSDAAAAMKTSRVLLGWVAFYQTTAQIQVFAKLGEARYCRVTRMS